MTPPADGDATRCPLCGADNRCGAARGAATCWCFDAAIDPAAIAAIPARDRGRVCICARCARPAAVPSPCIGVCELDAAGATCTGCGRTVAEIAAWGALDDDARRAVLARLQADRRPQ
ncbi:MAG: cysteine-rich CWC family protein [Planctomycetota bacterium]